MKMNNPQFSIIIPIYNTEKELPRCLDSILEQSFKDFEIVLVDDGSKDGSGQLCDAYALKDERVKVIHKSNSGCSEARNSGVRIARGAYFLFVDSDDMWNDTKALADIDSIISKNKGIDVLCFGVEIVDENGKLEKIRVPQISSGLSKESKVRHLVYNNQYFSTSYVKALKKEFFFENDLFFIKGLLSEDIEWSARILIRCKDIAIYPNAFYKRIKRSEGSITASIGIKNITDILNSIEKGIVFVQENAENENMLSLYYEYWAYQYAMLFVLLRYLKKDEDYYPIVNRVEELKWLLKFDHVKKVKAVRMMTTVFGIKGTICLIDTFYKMRGH